MTTTDTTTTDPPKTSWSDVADYFDAASEWAFDEATSKDELEFAVNAGNAASACRALDDIAPEVLVLQRRMRADIDAHPLPDGWTATVCSHSGVTVKHDTYPRGRSSVYVACIDDFAWSVKLRDEDEEWTTAATLADVVTAHMAAGGAS